MVSIYAVIISKNDLLMSELVVNALGNDLVLIIPNLYNLY